MGVRDLFITVDLDLFGGEVDLGDLAEDEGVAEGRAEVDGGLFGVVCELIMAGDDVHTGRA